MNSLQELNRAGQSVWIDFLNRDLIENGGLNRLIREYGIGGVTSNPTIFRKAITGSHHYDRALLPLAERDATAHEAFYELALGDVRMAADLFRPKYDHSRGMDGFVSFELEPNLAHSTDATIAAAAQIFAELNRPNVMIKVPGTVEGATAVEDLTYRGVNVNITLLFSIEAYEAVAYAYLRGLERRLEVGQPIEGISSVASFFVSRVDAAADALMAPDSPLRGKVGIANARLAYDRFRKIFAGPRWRRLAEAGAKLQRPLWASTGTKDPTSSDVMYVEELVGQDTIVTLPEPTLQAFVDHGRVRDDALVAGIDEARQVIEQLPSAGIDLAQITAKLLDLGLSIFEVDLEAALSQIRGRLHELSFGRAVAGARNG
jgi:transaldolase